MAPQPTIEPMRPNLEKFRAVLPALAVVLTAYVYIVRERLAQAPDAFRGFGFHPSALSAASVQVKAHLLASIVVVVVGVWQLTARKGNLPHRVVGWFWSISMLMAMGSALAIRSQAGTLEIVAVVVLVLLARAIWLARSGRTGEHARQMKMLFYGATLSVGLFTAVPGRVTWMLFFSGT